MILVKFIWTDRGNRGFLWIALALTCTLWPLFKYFYPSPNLVLDSYYYIKAAVLRLDTNAWPIGYSKFLRLYNLFSHSPGGLVTLQFIFLQLSLLIFFFTWRLFFLPGKWISCLLFALLFANPLLFYCCNYVLSDALFISLSLLWITQLLWVVYRPRPWMIVSHALLLILAFTIRYNALYYPFIGALAFFISRQRRIYKLAGIVLPLALVASFIFYTRHRAADSGGEQQFSAFGGWKMANDALYMYAHVFSDHPQPVPEKFRTLDSMVRRYFVDYQEKGDILTPDYTSGSFFMFAGESPLVQYMFRQSGRAYYWPFLNSRHWLAVAPFFQSYGAYLIGKYPLAFAQYFLWPNMIRWINPPGEIFGSEMPFQWVEAYGGVYVRACLSMDGMSFSKRSISVSKDILYLYPKISAAVHLAFIIGLLGFLSSGGFRRLVNPVKDGLILITALWGCDLCFSLLSAAVVLRYEIFMMILEMAFGLYFIGYTYKSLDRQATPAHHP